MTWINLSVRPCGFLEPKQVLRAQPIANTALAPAFLLMAGAASIGMMIIVNFAIDSDFKWLPLAVAAVWLGSISMYLLEGRRRVRSKDTGTG